MTLHLVASNAVVVAHHFNPTITDQIWLAKHKIIDPEEAEGGYIYTDALVQVQAKDFHLLIVPDKCQFTPAPTSEDSAQLIAERLGKLVEELPHTPYRAVGMNFVWRLDADEAAVRDIGRRIAFVQSSPLHQEFNVPDARFGTYLSKDSLGCRLKLDVKPFTEQQKAKEGDPKEGEPKSMIQFSFNYHRELAGEADPVSAIKDALAQWSEAQRESSVIVGTVEGVQT